jgi:diguanylate cyclase (GGDEF)-like protein
LAHALLYSPCIVVALIAMLLRSKPESVFVVAFVAAIIALVAAAWLVVRGASVYVATQTRVIAPWFDASVGSRLSSTAWPGDPLGAAAEAFATATGWSALFAAIAVAASALAFAALRRLAAQRAELEARLDAERTHDALTGLPNRRFFGEWLVFAIAHARREQAHVGVLFIDIDGCAAVVEHHGGPAAEALLVEIARRFRAAARGGDVFARLGSTQFALATPNAEHLRELAAIAQRLRDVLDDPAQPPLADSPIGTSIGMAFYPEDAGDSAGVMAAANVAMFAARRAGRRHVAFNALAA